MRADLRRFFADLGIPPRAVTQSDVLAFVAATHEPPRQLRRRIRRVHDYYAFLAARGVHLDNPVPAELAVHGPPPIRAGPGSELAVLTAVETSALLNELRTRRDRAIVLALLLGGLRAQEVLGLRVGDVRPKKLLLAVGPERRAVPLAPPFFVAVDAYVTAERPPAAGTDRLFLVEKGPSRGTPFSKVQLREMLGRARVRAHLDRLGGGRLREAGLQCLRAGGIEEDALRMQIGKQPRIPRSARWHRDEYQRVAGCLDRLLPAPEHS